MIGRLSVRFQAAVALAAIASVAALAVAWLGGSALAALSVLAVLLPVAWLVSGWLLGPLSSLTAAAQRLQDGDLAASFRRPGRRRHRWRRH